ncbi:HD phosphohydrolase domain-containing protein [Rozella allomycis CSF55]|uniref:HD domain-containing protein n=1 Tax=Rozella allomycis (strain CSF55) TaxID=988480 RepID=A0A075B0U7_ROZAC|nr:HD domain-containing protein [Rozella allomycis CSF55]RKP20809.1 HD phosphohydrolase domain-containing protein [Rozella allomycis CSF55]|eukprot:EPZ36023.1 HD domain-containing protein [Rozella allomycis CSF55]
MELKLYNDPIHGHIHLDPMTVSIMDTVHFQRLRDLKQLGVCYYVFPGACHNRFEHSVGVSYLANNMVSFLQQSQPLLDLTSNEISCVKLAGLCHDLGHGPFSHAYDNEFLPRASPGLNWSHEDGSQSLFNDLIDRYYIDIDPQDHKLILKLIDGNSKSSDMERGFLYDVVANKRNSVDVDKFDYITRDCYYSGIKSSYDSNRLLKCSRVIGNEICFHAKEAYNVYEMFHTRYSLFKRVYTHRVSKGLEYMIIDAMLAADPVMRISKAMEDPMEYVYLTDGILREIERSKNPKLSESQKILKRFRERDIYKFVDEYFYPAEQGSKIKKSIQLEEKIAQDIVSFQTDNSNINNNDVIVEIQKINYAMKDKNPVDKIHFYSKYDEDTPISINKEHVSSLIPNKMEETICRVFTRDSAKVKQVQEAFRRYVQKNTHYYKEETEKIYNESLTIPHGYEASPRKKNLSLNSSPINKKRKIPFDINK